MPRKKPEEAPRKEAPELRSWISQWPATPQKKSFYHEGLSPEEATHIEKLGWELVDIRLLPSKKNTERATAVKAVLEGIRVGSIAGDQTRLRFLDLEARICGLLNKTQPKEKATRSDKKTLDKILDFGRAPEVQ